MAKYTEDAQKLLEAVGGRENIGAVTHCATRMRFVLKDPSKADVKMVEKIGAVKGSFTQAGQFQAIIGNDVSNFYNEFSSLAKVDGVSKEEAKSAAKSNMTGLQRLMANLAEIFAPIIPALIVGGLILGFRNLMEVGENPLIKQGQFWAGLHSFLWLISEAIFHFLPVGITWSVTKKMGTTQILGIILGITLVSPQLVNAYGYADAVKNNTLNFWDFGFAKIPMIGYQAQVIPALLAGFLLVYLERWIRKVIPEYLSMIFVPFFALIPTVLIAHTILGPIGWKIGSLISTGVLWGLQGSFKGIFSALFGFLYAPLVITGLHHMTNAIDLTLIATKPLESTPLWPMIALSNIAQGSAVLAMVIKNRHDKKEQQVSIPSSISAYLGVTEPAMFGINLKYMYPFLAAMIGSAIAGCVSVVSGVTAYSIGVGGLPGILAIKTEKWMFLVAMVIAVIVPFILTFILSKLPRFKVEKVVDNTSLDNM